MSGVARQVRPAPLVDDVDDAGPQIAGSEVAAVDHPVEVDGCLARSAGAVTGDHAERYALGGVRYGRGAAKRLAEGAGGDGRG
jgi:hypothetical protein